MQPAARQMPLVAGGPGAINLMNRFRDVKHTYNMIRNRGIYGLKAQFTCLVSACEPVCIRLFDVDCERGPWLRLTGAENVCRYDADQSLVRQLEEDGTDLEAGQYLCH